MMKKWLAIALCMGLCAGTAACADRVEVEPAMYLGAESTSVQASQTPSSTDAPNPQEDGARNRAFVEALTTALYNEEETPYRFALADVDKDGEQELILLCDSQITAGMTAQVLDYDAAEDTLREELNEFPMLTFYDNGVAMADWSHNQGLAGEFWPYSLYRYSSSAGRYELVAMVDACDRVFAQSAGQDDVFPEEVDQSGAGIVYYIMTDGEYDTSHPVDQKEYDRWLESCIGGAEEIEIVYQELTQERLAQFP